MANKKTEQELKSIQEINEKFVKLKSQLGEVSIQNHILLRLMSHVGMGKIILHFI